jgi:phosphatidylglycerophosphatase C
VRRHRIVLGALPLSPLVLCYRLGLIPAPQARPIVSRVGFQGEAVDSIRQVGTRRKCFQASFASRQLSASSGTKAKAIQSSIVSASLDAYLSPWCDSFGVELICTELEERDGRLTGRYCDGDCSGPAEVRRILERYDLSRYAVIYAYGDTNDGREMLELAHRKFYRWREIQDWSEAAALGMEHHWNASSQQIRVRISPEGITNHQTGD